MTRGQVPGLINHRNLKRFGEFDEMLHASFGMHEVSGDEHRILGRDQELGRFHDRAGISLRRPIQGELRYAQRGVLRNRRLHQGAVEHDDDGLSRRRHGDLVGANGGLREMRQRDGEVVPLGIVADHGGRVLGAVIPLHAGAPLVGVNGIANHNDNRRPARPGIIDAHGGML